MTNSPGLFSVALLSYFSASRLEKITSYYINGLEKENIPFEFIIMDDGSEDNSYQIACHLEKKDPRIRAFRLSKNYTSPYAQFASMKVAHGDCIMFVSDDFQRPVENIIACYRKWQEGHKIVLVGRETRSDGFINNIFSNFYYWIMNNLSDLSFPRGGTDGFLADREVIDIVNNTISPVHTSAVAEILRLGFEPCIIHRPRPKPTIKSRWTWKKKVNLAMDTFLAASSFPIKLITWMGLLMFFLSLLIIIIVISAKLFSDNTLFGFPIPGWATIITLISLFQGLVLLSMGIIAEYIWRIYEEVKGRPGFIIRDKENDQRFK